MATDYIPNSDDLLEIGRIPNMRSEIDPQQTEDPNSNIAGYLKSKMSVIDLIPCLFSVPYSNILSATNMANTAPTLKYESAINNFRQICRGYGLKEYSFLRLYLTDMTSSTDEMSNEYTKNIIDDTLNNATMQRMMSPFVSANKIAESTGSKTPSASKTVDEFSKNYLNIDISQIAIDKMDLAQSILTHGSRISFPKIWSNSSYSPNLQCVIKLVSPYGHPKAVNEFIIKPLSYILILLSPTTKQGLTTEKPSYLTMKSYGLSNLSLCYPGQLQIRRGGDDSNYNKFKQPMVVEVALTFQAVTEGFACYLPSGVEDSYTGESLLYTPESGIFSSGNEIALKSFEKDFDQPSSLFPTLKSIVNSFRPFGYEATTGSGSDTSGTNLYQSSLETGGIVNGGESENPLPPVIIPDSGDIPTDNDSFELVPSAIYLTSGALVFTSPNTTAPFEIEIVTDALPATSNEYNPLDFEADDNFTKIETNEDTSQHILTTSSSFSLETKVLRIRTLPPTTSILTNPGIWSESITSCVPTIEEVTPPAVRVTPLILPTHSIYTNDARWILEDETGQVIGPFVGCIADVFSGECTIRVQDLAGNILNEENITISSDTEIIETYLTTTLGSLRVFFTAPSYIDISNITYLLISDFGESNTEEHKNNDIVSDLQTGMYYMSVKYDEYPVQYYPGVSNYVNIVDTSLKVVHIEIDSNLKITSVSEVS